MYGTPLGLDEAEQTVSKYVAMVQEGLRAAYRHGVASDTTTMERSRDGSTRQESWYGSTM